MQNLDTEIIPSTVAQERSSKRKRRTIIAIVVLLVLSVMTMLVQSMIPLMFDLVPWMEQAYYIGVTYGLPLTFLILALALGASIALLMSKTRSYKQRWMQSFRVVYLVLMSIAFLFLVMMQIGISIDTSGSFGKGENYQEIAAFQGDTEDIRMGKFYLNGDLLLERFEDYQIEYNPITGDSTRFELKWISGSEYFIVAPKGHAAADTLFVKITDNQPAYYAFVLSLDRVQGMHGKLDKQP
ncbi:MAG: hypothetical protein H6599_00975 [Flavobacteriales bacterium]|nr:hypothetical protein [Flavobacteriales bacterium]